MAVTNSDIARLFARYATLLEIESANPFRVRAYRNVARLVQEMPRSVADRVAHAEDLTELEGVGEDLAGKLREVVETGRLGVLDALERRLPPALVELTLLPGLGPKRVKLLYETLNVRTFEDLLKAARAGRIRAVRGFGTKTEERILRALLERRGREARVLWSDAEQLVEPLLEALRRTPGVSAAAVAGSFRRRRETVGDLDIVAASTAPARAIERFVSQQAVREIVSSGPTRATVRLHSGLQVDLRVVAKESYGAALQYFTGSKAHNIALRARAAAHGLKLSEYGLFEARMRLAGRREAEIYRALGLRYIEPELRENRGEIAAAEKGELPRIVASADIRGDLHCHTDASDGRDTLEAMARAAKDLGYEYLAITDHSRRLRVAHGLDARRLAQQLAKIDRLNATLGEFRLLKAAEVDILEDGSLDLPNSVLRDLDFVVGAVHYALDLPRARQTQRLIRAMDNPHLHLVAHPTGRLLGKREACALDFERLLVAAAERGCFFEVNAQPQRLDLRDVECRLAKTMGVKVAICTDAHSAAQLGYLRFGVAQARRGWLERGDVLNARPWVQVERLLRWR